MRFNAASEHDKQHYRKRTTLMALQCGTGTKAKWVTLWDHRMKELTGWIMPHTDLLHHPA
jgi:hypothetical protein